MDRAGDTGGSDVPSSALDLDRADALRSELAALRASLVDAEARLAAASPAPLSPSARNLAHYMALRQHDLRPLQERLAAIGLSSLGRAETHVLANVDQVLAVLHLLAGRCGRPRTNDEPSGALAGQALLARRSAALFGPPPQGRAVRIMVTLPSAAARDPALVRSLVDAGMDVARINCAHDDACAWAAMAAQVRAAARDASRAVRVMMDLAGPKIRTGPIAPGPAVLKLRPRRDDFGRVVAPARLELRAAGAAADSSGEVPALPVDPGWLAALDRGDRIRLRDARGRVRRLRVVATSPGAARVESRRTVYLVNGTELEVVGGDAAATTVTGLAPRPGRLTLARGDRLRLTREGVGTDAADGRPAQVACTLPQVLDQVRKGEAVWLDDGRVGGVVRRVTRGWVEVEVTEAGDGGETVAADKGINLPDTRLDLPALTAKDVDDLPTVARLADIVALSFAQGAADVRALRRELDAVGASRLGVVLKIETRRGFQHLPEMLFELMQAPAAGVMIARGDLAVECGFERLAEVQEEILWACEAAHLPVIWATQVLESQARSGRPSRAEVTDAAMGVRADCVMLNKGPHIVDAMHTLDDILRRMQQHQSKKRSLLRALKSWTPPRTAPA